MSYFSKNLERKGPSLGVIQPTRPHECSPHAPNYEDSRRDMKTRAMRPREMRGNWPKAFTSSKINTKHFSSRPRMFGVFQHHPQENQRKENLLSDSGAPVHMLSRKDLNSADMETVRVPRNLQRS